MGAGAAAAAQDSFYKNLGPAELELARAKNYNFDHPDAFDTGLMMKCLGELKVRAATGCRVEHWKLG